MPRVHRNGAHGVRPAEDSEVYDRGGREDPTQLSAHAVVSTLRCGLLPWPRDMWLAEFTFLLVLAKDIVQKVGIANVHAFWGPV